MKAISLVVLRIGETIASDSSTSISKASSEMITLPRIPRPDSKDVEINVLPFLRVQDAESLETCTKLLEFEACISLAMLAF